MLRSALFRVASLGAVLTALFTLTCLQLADPDIAFLAPRGGAEWIRLPGPVDLFAHPPQDSFALFRVRFTVARLPAAAPLTICAMKDASAFLDGRRILPRDGDMSRWKSCREIRLEGFLGQGAHELRVEVMNRNGPAVLWAFCPALALATSSKWDVTRYATSWSPAQPVDRFVPAPLSLMFPRADRAVRSLLPIFIACLLVFAVVSWAHTRARGGFPGLPRAAQARWLLIGAWIALALNNILKIPSSIGFDVRSHLDYIALIARGHLPLVTEGAQMFQPPLFYALSAPLHVIFAHLFAPDIAARMLRAIPLLCGLGQVELAYRAACLVFKDREDLKMMAVILGGLLPMSLYSAQAVGNEPLAGVLTAAIVVLGISIARKKIPSRSRQALLGLLLGAALLAKATAILMIPPLAFLLAFSGSKSERSPRAAASALAVVLGTAFLVAGWYYVRNWILLGKPFVGGWENPGIAWWQDPGYRTIGQFLTFGESLSRPIFSCTRGFWDAIYSSLWLDGQLSGRGLYEYRPPWNYGFMISGAWLAVLPSIGILIGVVKALAVPVSAGRDGRLFCAVCLGVYYIALIALYMKVPVYSTAKATYTLGLLPCYGVLGASGLGVLARNRVLRTTIYSWMTIWALSAYAAYFVI